MYEQFTDRAKKVMELAVQEAYRFNHEYVGTEHVLLGLAAEDSGVAARVLNDLGVDLKRVRHEVVKIVQRGPEGTSLTKLPHTPRTKKVIEYSIEESRALGHNYVGSEHLLLGLLRESEGLAAQVLLNFGLRLNTVRREVLLLLGHPVDAACDGGGEGDNAELRHLPPCAREIVAEFDCQIDVIQEDWAADDAAEMKKMADLCEKLGRLRAELIRQWPGD